MNWTQEQGVALMRVGEWIRNRYSRVFYLAGYAGTGKTTLAIHLAEQTEGQVFFGAFTGKAALVMRRKGCPGACTLHSLLYKVLPHGSGHLEELEADLESWLKRDPGTEREAAIFRLRREIAAEKKKIGKPTFSLNPDSPLKGAALLVVDECSMVDERLGADILSFGVPVLALGDPAQLPPVYGAGYFTKGKPDFFLSEIQRQAADNPIIQLATQLRNEKLPEVGTYGESRVIPTAAFDKRTMNLEAQVIVGRNATRRRANAFLRERRGFSGETPVSGDRVICLRNCHEMGLLNGSLWDVTGTVPNAEPDLLTLQVRSRDEDVGAFTVDAYRGPFRGEEVDHPQKEIQSFDFGYAITCHKSQGSEFPEVVVVDEGACFRKDVWRWRYTAVTRAAEKLTLVL